MPKRTMKKFHVSLDLTADDLYVWGEDVETVEEAISECGLSNLVDSFNVAFAIQATEVPSRDATHITDGVVTEDDGWIHQDDFTDENGNRIEPTDKEVDPNYVTQEELEAAGQLRLFLEPPEHGGTLATPLPEPTETLSTDPIK
jgi:hypothetical protein